MLEYRRLRLPGQPLRGQVQELATERTDVVGRQVEMVQPLAHGASPCVSWRVRPGAGYLPGPEPGAVLAGCHRLNKLVTPRLGCSATTSKPPPRSVLTFPGLSVSSTPRTTRGPPHSHHAA